MGKKITEPEKTYASFGELLNYYMSSAGMTGEKLAEELGYTPETISKYVARMTMMTAMKKANSAFTGCRICRAIQ